MMQWPPESQSNNPATGLNFNFVITANAVSAPQLPCGWLSSDSGSPEKSLDPRLRPDHGILGDFGEAGITS